MEWNEYFIIKFLTLFLDSSLVVIPFLCHVSLSVEKKRIDPVMLPVIVIKMLSTHCGTTDMKDDTQCIVSSEAVQQNVGIEFQK